ncbi:hypothetical protein [Actinomadura fibrosa]|uniref:Uncharacterized protein n=1 Tax=Actinomadura fibrosa TaxID=111802 RepID=A0ABW2Y0Y4_9ACTN|nr:hypothetical protein [Actinomadura fibrosa]
MSTRNKLDVSTYVRHEMKNLNDIYDNLRALENGHMTEPSDDNLSDYDMLVDDLEATLQNLLRALNRARPNLEPPEPAKDDFPTPLSGSLSTTAQPTRPRQQRPAGHERLAESP